MGGYGPWERSYQTQDLIKSLAPIFSLSSHNNAQSRREFIFAFCCVGVPSAQARIYKFTPLSPCLGTELRGSQNIDSTPKRLTHGLKANGETMITRSRYVLIDTLFHIHSANVISPKYHNGLYSFLSLEPKTKVSHSLLCFGEPRT